MARMARLKRIRGVVGGVGSKAVAALASRTVAIDNSAGGALTDYPVKVAVPALTDMGANFDNLRFKSGATVLSYWRESFTASTSAVFWVKVPSIAAGGTTNITMEWGAGVTDASNGNNVFSLYDNFDEALPVQANNTTTASVSTAGYLAENIVFDSVTNKYWWIFQDNTTTPSAIRLASSDSITSPSWTVEAAPVITAAVALMSPHIVKFGSTWYIYYGYNDPGNIYCQSSSMVNSGYSATGITNPQLTVGAAGSWESRRVSEPYVFLVNSTYYMFYMGEDTANLYEKVGYATASSPTGPWTKYGSNPVLSGDTGWWDTGQDKAADPWVIEKDGTYYVGMTACVTDKNYWRTGVFTTTDFVTFTPVANNPVLPWGESGQMDASAAFRGAVSLFGGVYYFAYTGRSATAEFRLSLTTLNFSTVGVNNAKWHERVSVDQGTSLVTLNAVTDYLESTATFGQGYALRSRSKFASATNIGLIAFRDKSDSTSDYLEMIANYPSTNTKGYQNVSADSSTANLGTCGAYHIYEIQRNANTNGRYAIDDAAATELTTQLPAGALPILLNQIVETDWLAVRKYASPEPTATVGAS